MNVLSRALRDLGRLVKTQFILRWIENPDYRRRIHRQLNKGEALHALRRFLFFAHQGKVQRRQADQQTNQVLCLNLVTNAIVTWNTVYMNAAIERLRAEGRIGRDIDLGHLSPALYGHVNPYGKYRFEIEGRAPSLRPLRSPGCRNPDADEVWTRDGDSRRASKIGRNLLIIKKLYSYYVFCCPHSCPHISRPGCPSTSCRFAVCPPAL